MATDRVPMDPFLASLTPAMPPPDRSRLEAALGEARAMGYMVLPGVDCEHQRFLHRAALAFAAQMVDSGFLLKTPAGRRDHAGLIADAALLLARTLWGRFQAPELPAPPPAPQTLVCGECGRDEGECTCDDGKCLDCDDVANPDCDTGRCTAHCVERCDSSCERSLRLEEDRQARRAAGLPETGDGEE